MQNTLSRGRSAVVAGVAAMTAMCLMLMLQASNALAAADASTTSAVTDATTTLVDTIKAATPLIIGVAVFWVILGLGKRLVRKAG